MNKLVAPFVKWVGGKRQLLDTLSDLLPPESKRVSTHKYKAYMKDMKE